MTQALSRDKYESNISPSTGNDSLENYYSFRQESAGKAIILISYDISSRQVLEAG